MREKLQMGESTVVILECPDESWNIIAILEDGRGGMVTIPGKNIITNDGDLHYAQRSAAETPTVAFASGGIRLGSGTTAPTKTDTDVTTFLAGTGIAVVSGYPKTNDADVRNTGAGTDIVTWLYSYTLSQGVASAIAEGAIVDNITTPTKALTHFLFGASFNKSSIATLSIFVNHRMNGV